MQHYFSNIRQFFKMSKVMAKGLRKQLQQVIQQPMAKKLPTQGKPQIEQVKI